MLSYAAIAGILLALYLANNCFNLARNYIRARRLGIPIIVIPFHYQSVLYLIFSSIYHKQLRRLLPECVYDHLAPTIPQIWENQLKRKLFVKWNTKSFVVVNHRAIGLQTCDPEVIVEELRRINDFHQPMRTKLFLDVFGTNVISSDGPSWSKQRKLVTSVINERISRTVFEESHRQTRFLIDDITASQAGGESTGALAIDGVRRIAINVLAKTGYGQDQTWEESKLSDDFDVDTQIDFVTAIKACIENLVVARILPVAVMVNWPSWLPGQRLVRQIGIGKREFPILAQARIEQERAEQASNNNEFLRQSMLSQLVRNADQAGKETSMGDSKHEPLGLTDKELHGNLFVFTIAGYDTTATVLQFACVFLAAFPSVQDWLLEEIEQLYPASTGPENAVDYAAIFPKAHRCQALMHEVMRLIPPIPHNNKENASPQVIQTSTHTFHIPEQTTVYNCAPAVQTDPTIWRHLNDPGHPQPSSTTVKETLQDATDMVADEYRFRPQRWINLDQSRGPVYKPTPGTFLAWSAGPRVCPGAKMSQVEFVGVIVTLLSEFRIEGVRRKIRTKDEKEEREETQHELAERYLAITRDLVQKITQQMTRVDEIDLRFVPRRT